ncbi:MAG: hypothetical protein J1G05_05645 [Clostridiales bacterium]|nr:hypothetical protein [Clostridiales bacterium]
MDIYQILTLIISFLSIIISFIAVIIAYLPYAKKIVFKVSLNPFTKSDDGIEICFLIVNKTNKDLIVESLNAIKILSVQIFDKEDFPHLVKANDSEMFSINSSKLKFNSIQVFNEEIIEEKEKHLKYIKFCILNSIRESITYKMRIKDYINACNIYELYKKNREGECDLESDIKLHNEILYFGKKNKSRH